MGRSFPSAWGPFWHLRIYCATFCFRVSPVFVRGTRPTRRKVFPHPTVGAPSASNSPRALSAQALRDDITDIGEYIKNNFLGKLLGQWYIFISHISTEVVHKWTIKNMKKCNQFWTREEIRPSSLFSCSTLAAYFASSCSERSLLRRPARQKSAFGTSLTSARSSAARS